MCPKYRNTAHLLLHHLCTCVLPQVVMAGGASRMPAVRRLVAALAGAAPRETVNPEACVALGAAIQAGMLVGEVSGHPSHLLYPTIPYPTLTVTLATF